MQFTKSQEELQARRARVKEMQAQGRVMNDSMRASIKKQRKYLSSLEEKADLILTGMNVNTNRRTRATSKNQNQSVSETTSTRRLSLNDKYDKLAVEASKIIQELVQ